MFLADVTSVVDFFVNSFLSIFNYLYSTLDSLTFHGITFLDFIISGIVLGVIFPIILSLVKPSVRGSERSYRNSVKQAERQQRKNGG